MGLNGFERPAKTKRKNHDLFRWLQIALVCNIFFAIIILLLFTLNTYRYIVDLTPTATLPAILRFADFRDRLTGFEGWFWHLGWQLTAALTPIFGILIAITGYAIAFERHITELYTRLLNIFP